MKETMTPPADPAAEAPAFAAQVEPAVAPELPIAIDPPEPAVQRTGPNTRAQLETYYNESGMDYAAWSPRFNMHFGFWRKGLSLFRLEPMLEEMNRQVRHRLVGKAAGRFDGTVLDLGCGLGASTRSFAAAEPAMDIIGVSIVPWQIAQARKFSAERPAAERARTRFIEADYTALPRDTIANNTIDGAVNIESACHADGLGKAALVREVARVLRPGARWVVVDGFLKRGQPRNRLLRWCVDTVCHNWAVETFADLDTFTAELEAEGFIDIQVEEISWNVAPSAMHIPRVTAAFLFGELMPRWRRRGNKADGTTDGTIDRTGPRKTMTRARWGHVRACVLAPFVGLARRTFGYYIVTARAGCSR